MEDKITIQSDNKNMKQFSLEEYLKNPSRKVITRDDKAVRIICIDKKGNNYPIIALVKYGCGEEIRCYTKNGEHTNCKLSYDLFFAPEKHEGWINIYKENTEIKGKNKEFRGAYIYSSKEKALEAGRCFNGYITTTKIEWED